MAYGIATGGSDFATKNQQGLFGGGSGAGARRRYYAITPAGKEACYQLMLEWKETKEIMDQLLITEE